MYQDWIVQPVNADLDYLQTQGGGERRRRCAAIRIEAAYQCIFLLQGSGRISC